MQRVLLLNGAEKLPWLRQDLEAQGLQVTEASTGWQSTETALKCKPQVIVTSFSPESAYAINLVKTIRGSDAQVRIVLVSEAAMDRRMQEYLRTLDVDGMVRPDHGRDAFVLWVRSAMRSYLDRTEGERRRDAIRNLVKAVSDLQDVATAEQLLRLVLSRLQDIVGVGHSALAALANGRSHARRLEVVSSSVWGEQRAALRIVAATHPHLEDSRTHHLLPSLRRFLYEKDVAVEGNYHFLPLYSGKETLGIIALEHHADCECDAELLGMLSVGISQALEIRRLTSLASEDDLTHVYTRDFFFKLAEYAIQNAAREEQTFSLGVLDVDYFKKINDTQGHLAGDRVLREIGNLLRTSLRPQDYVGRFGGDEFLVGMPHTSRAVATQVMERLREKVESTFKVDGVPQVTISSGVVGLDCSAVGSRKPLVTCCAAANIFRKMLLSADRQLYVSKARGRNCLSVGDEYHLSVLSVLMAIPTKEWVKDAEAEEPNVEARQLVALAG